MDCKHCKHFVYDADCLEVWMCERVYEGQSCQYEPIEEHKEDE